VTNDDRAETAAADNWVSFSDILLTLVCAVLFLRMVQSRSQGDVQKSRDFEQRLGVLEQTSTELESMAQQVVAEVDELGAALDQTNPPQTQGRAE
jgi:hypothetical protein